jgi:hypothetical protein
VVRRHSPRTLGCFYTMKPESQTNILMLMPPTLLVMSIRFESLQNFRTFATLWICCSLACLARGVWILKRDRKVGRICIVRAVLYLFLLAMLVPPLT